MKNNRYEIQTVRLHDGHEMKVTVFGSGKRSFVIIPGMSLTPVWKTAGAMAALYAGFTERYRFFIFDRKENFGPDYTVEKMAEDTAEAMGMCGIEKAFVYGASQGGMIALSLALDFPDMVSAAAIASSASRNNDVSKETLLRWKELAEKGNIMELARNSFCKVYSEAVQKRALDAYTRLAGTYTPEMCEPFGILADACLKFDRYDDLGRIECPLFVTGGGRDMIFGASSSLEIAEKSGGMCYIYEDGPHAVYDEKSDFVGRIVSFFDGVPQHS